MRAGFTKLLSRKKLKAIKDQKALLTILLGCISILLFYSCILVFLNFKEVQSGSTISETFWVDGSVGISGDCLNQETACKTIQETVDLIDGGGDVVKIRGTHPTTSEPIQYPETIEIIQKASENNINGATIEGWDGKPALLAPVLEATDSRWDTTHTNLINGTGAPTARDDHTAVWTGITNDGRSSKKMIVWGGEQHTATGFTYYQNTGGIYDPNGDEWTYLSTLNAPVKRAWHTAVWTGNAGDPDTKYRMIVWGGADSSSGGGNTGGVLYFDSGTGEWKWDTTKTCLRTGLAANCPNSNPAGFVPGGRLEHTAVWAGSHMIVWGGRISATYLKSGGIYDLKNDGWVATEEATAPAGRYGHTAVWSGDTGNPNTEYRMIVWGGFGPSPTYHNTGGMWRPNGVDGCTNTGGCWIFTTLTNAPSGRWYHTGIWTGDTGDPDTANKMIIFGGSVGYTGGYQNLTNTGGIFDPSYDIDGKWLTEGYSNLRNGTGAPSGRWQHTAFWTGTDGMVIWGGRDNATATYYNGQPTNTGGIYIPKSETLGNDTWLPTPSENMPSARHSHTAVRGLSSNCALQMIVWGGTNYTEKIGGGSGASLNNGRILLVGGGVGTPAIHILNKGDNPSYLNIENVTIRNLKISLCCGEAIRIETTDTASDIKDVIVASNEITSNPAGIKFQANGKIVSTAISSNLISNSKGKGIDFDAGGSIEASYLRGNTISSNFGSSICFNAVGKIANNAFSSNSITSNQGVGIDLNTSDSDTGMDSNLFYANTIRDNTESAINLISPKFSFNSIIKNIVINNGFSAPAGGTINIYDGQATPTTSIPSSVILENLISSNRGYPLYLKGTSLSNNHIEGNIIHSNNDGTSDLGISDASVDDSAGNKFIHNNILPLLIGDSLTRRNNIIGLTDTGSLPSPTFDIIAAIGDLHYQYSSTASASSTASIIFDTTLPSWITDQWLGKAVFLEGCPAITPQYSGIIANDVNSLTVYPAFSAEVDNCTFKITDFYLASITSQDQAGSPLGNGASSINGIWGDGDDDNAVISDNIDETDYGIINIGARKGFIINKNQEGQSDEVISNSIQLSHDNDSTSAPDILNVYSIKEAGSSFMATPAADSGIPGIKILNANNFLDQNNQYIGNYVLMVSGTGTNIGRVYPIVKTLIYGTTGSYRDFIYIPAELTVGFAAGDEFIILDRIYTEDLNQPTSQISLSKKGNPGWSITWQSRTWDKSLATPAWSEDLPITLDAQNDLEYNLFAEDSVKCLAFKDFNFLNATLTSPFGPPENEPDIQDCTGISPNLTCPEISWSCIPYSYLELNSKTYDTGVHGGVAYNSILWFGSPPPGLPEYDSNSHAKYLKMQLAASDCPNGYSGPKDNPVYDQKCQDMIQDYWGKEYDPGLNKYGSPFYGDNTEEGINCQETNYYYPDPDEITPIKGECFNNLYNKRYFKYKLILNYYDLDKNGYASEGDTTTKVDEIVINYSR